MCATYVCTSPIWQLTDSEYVWCLQAFKQSEKELPPNAIYVQAQGRALGGLTEVGPSTPRSEGTGPSNGLKRASPNLNVQVALTLNYGVRHERPMERVRSESRRRALRSGVWGHRRTPETGPRLRVCAASRSPSRAASHPHWPPVPRHRAWQGRPQGTSPASEHEGPPLGHPGQGALEVLRGTVKVLGPLGRRPSQTVSGRLQ